MFGSSVELENLSNQLVELRSQKHALEIELAGAREATNEAKEALRDTKWKLTILEKEAELSTEKKLAELRKSMQESLIKSDLLRTEALAKLEIYEKTDTKADANTIKEMIGQLIGTIGKQNVNVIK
jgi:hypothetical protein